MADGTKIEWAEATWNPITGCSVVSPGCTNCYAMKLAGGRLRHHPSRQGLTRETKAGPVWNGAFRFNGPWLDQPLRWTKPRRIFVCAHGDLFYESVPDEWIDRVFAVMALCPLHQFLVLTKRPERMRAYIAGPYERDGVCARIAEATRLIRAVDDRLPVSLSDRPVGPIMPDGEPEFGFRRFLNPNCWPLPNVWLGVSVEDQQRADERIPVLLDTPAALRWVSAEPLLEGISFGCIPWISNRGFVDALTGKTEFDGVKARPGDPPPPGQIAWLVAGGESGPGARPFDIGWARSIIAQGRAARVPVFVKQLGARRFDSGDCLTRFLDERGEWVVIRDKKGGDPAEWPADLRVREFPKVAA